MPHSLETSKSAVCPRCRSHSVIRSHATLACLPCGYVVEEPARDIWGLAAFLRPPSAVPDTRQHHERLPWPRETSVEGGVGVTHNETQADSSESRNEN